MNTIHSAPRACLYTLGCKVNQYESEAIGEALEEKGISVALSEEEGQVYDLYIINTCTVTAESDRKARQLIRRALSHNPDAFILVTGCLAQTAADTIRAIPGVDFVCGNKNKMEIVDAALALWNRGSKMDDPHLSVSGLDGAAFEPMCIRHFGRTRAYIKIEDGCESHCTYGIIPTARGKIRSKPLGDVVKEAQILTEGGCREIVLTGIETASWGRDFQTGEDLGDLLRAVDAIPGIGRVRLGSLDPTLMRPAFVEKIRELTSLAPHFHLSMQSGSNRVLAAMKRKYNRSQALEAIRRLREAIPDVQFTTDMIVGFPGETDEDFADTLALAKEARFLMIHVFPYSRRQGTPAADMPDQIPEETKHQRVRALQAVAAGIRKEILSEVVRTSPVVPVLFETFDGTDAIGHTPSFLQVRAPSAQPLHGQILRVMLDGAEANGDGCIGRILTEEERK